MLFKKHEEGHKKRGPSLPFVIFRSFLSFVMLCVLGLVFLQAYKHFSGVDPLEIDPKNALVSFITSEKSAKITKELLSFNVPTNVSELKQIVKNEPSSNSKEDPQEHDTPSNAPLLFRFAIVSDSHIDNANLTKALNMAKREGVKFVIGLGDYSDVGTAEELGKAKAAFNQLGLPYYVTAGDHDLWDCRNRQQTPTCNFSPLFRSAYQTFEYSNIRFIMIYNSDNYLGVDTVQMRWLEDELTRIKAENPKQIFALMHEPLYHPSSDHYMGKSNPKIQTQAQTIAKMLYDARVGEVFAGDVHFFTQYSDPKSNLKMTTVGAVTEARNAQKPRFALVDVHEDGSYNVTDTEIK